MGFLIVDIEGTALTSEERELIQHPSVAGMILFTRNFENPEQLRSLTSSIKQSAPQLFIAADQEGGRVQRFRTGFTELPSMRTYGERYRKDPAGAKQALQRALKTTVGELRSAGIDINLAPVLDLDRGNSPVVGERSFGGDSAIVTELADVVISALHEAAMPAIGKHFPGHGGVVTDSHKELPVDEREASVIFAEDLQPFSNLSAKLDAVMPAHVIYTATDGKPASFSRYWLHDVLRGELHFAGAVISDDLSMKAVAGLGSYVERAEMALEAGCDLLTICNNRAGVIEVLDGLRPRISPESRDRVTAFVRKTH